MRFAYCLMAALLLTLIAMPAIAQTYTLASDGYYYLPGSTQAYTRTSTWTPGYTYYVGGCPYYQAGYYSYTYTAYTPAKTSAAYTPSWQIEHAKIAAAQVKADAAFRASLADYAAYQKSLDSLGITARGAWGGYPVGYGAAYLPTNSLLAGTFGINTSTVYGYNPQSLTQFVDPFRVSLDQYFLQSAQLAGGSQDAAKAAVDGFNSLVNNAANQAAALSNPTAMANALSILSQAIKTTPQSTSSSLTFTAGSNGKLTPAPATPAAPAAQAEDALSTRFKALATAKGCVKCHFGADGEEKQGNFSLTDLKDDRLLPSLVSGKMPKGGQKLTDAELLTFSQAQAADYAAAVSALAKPAAKKDVMPKIQK